MTNFDITSNGNIQVMGTNNGSIYIQNLNQYPNPSRKITGHSGFISSIGTNNGSSYIQSPNQYPNQSRINGHAGFISSIAVSSNSKLFVSGSRDWIKLWDLQTGEILNILEGESPKIKVLTITPSYKTLYSTN